MPKKLICPQCQEKRTLFKIYHVKENFKIESVEMCFECYQHFRQTKEMFIQTSVI